MITLLERKRLRSVRECAGLRGSMRIVCGMRGAWWGVREIWRGARSMQELAGVCGSMRESAEVCGKYVVSMRGSMRDVGASICLHAPRILPPYYPRTSAHFPKLPAYSRILPRTPATSCMLRTPFHISRAPRPAKLPHTPAYRILAHATGFVSRTCMPTNLPTQSRPSHLERFVC